MTVATKLKLKTLGEYASTAIQKQQKKILKWESSVKKDEDPEALHQMRVGMRRLRSVVNNFGIAVSLPKPIRDKNIGKIARRLGNLRDLDVLKETLETVYQPYLPFKEQQALQTVFHTLGKQREHTFLEVKATLKDDCYKSFKQGLKQWLEEPDYQPLASVPIYDVLPNLLLPEISSLFLHPGWLLGTKIQDSQVKVKTNLEPEEIDQQLKNTGEILHSLRKQAKRLRYQMELFTDFYGDSYATCVAQIENIQETLGLLQDSVVLAQWLEDILESKLETQLPTFASLLEQNRSKYWQQWQPLQEGYLKPDTRFEFYLTVLHPV